MITGTPCDAAAISRYADTIMKLIDADIAAGVVEADVPGFTELHDYVDANEYVIEAGVPFGSAEGAGEEGIGTVNTVTDEVDRRLAARAGAIARLTEDLTIGTRVRVPRRNGATGTIDGPPSMDNTVSPPRPTVSIMFDGKRTSWGLNYTEDVERIGRVSDPNAIIGRINALILRGLPESKARAQAIREALREA